MVKMPHWPIPYGAPEIDNNLSRMKNLLNAIGNPQNYLPKIIHVTGTNGKGSVMAFIKSILMEAGLKVHSYTSPHISRFNERINLNGKEIDDNFLHEIIENVRLKCPENIRPTFFEGTTAAAFLAFKEIPADILLVECGMGGMLDPTNVFNDIEMAIITPISLDHMEFLGNNIAKIAAQKSYIMKPNRKVIIAPQAREALAILKLYAEQIGSSTFCYEENYDFDSDGQNLVYIDMETEILNYYALPSLQGAHQISNASLAIAAVKNLKDYVISDEVISDGISKAVWPGRLEIITSGTLVDILKPESELWIDGAHNIGGAFAMASWISAMQDDKTNILIIGKSAKKDQQPFLQQFKGHVDKIFAITVEGEPKAENANIITNAAINIGLECQSADNLLDAIEKISQLKGPKRVLICGSLYLQNDLKKYNS
jgi:dihydrofolate synthase / folylpolyglutamate synthase